MPDRRYGVPERIEPAEQGDGPERPVAEVSGMAGSVPAAWSSWSFGPILRLTQRRKDAKKIAMFEWFAALLIPSEQDDR